MLRKRKAGLWLAALASLLVASVALAAVGWLSFVANAQPDGTIEVTWSTATELDVVAFNLYRGEHVEGPWGDPVDVRPSEGDAVSGATYTYVDYDATPNVTYYYRVEEVDNVGNAQANPNVVSARVSTGGPATNTPTVTPSLTPTRTPTTNTGSAATPPPTPGMVTATPVPTFTSGPGIPTATGSTFQSGLPTPLPPATPTATRPAAAVPPTSGAGGAATPYPASTPVPLATVPGAFQSPLSAAVPAATPTALQLTRSTAAATPSWAEHTPQPAVLSGPTGKTGTSALRPATGIDPAGGPSPWLLVLAGLALGMAAGMGWLAARTWRGGGF